MKIENSHNCDVLIYAEDPGGANFLAQLPQALEKQAVRTTTLCGNLAVNYFKSRQISVQSLEQDANTTTVFAEFKPKVLLTDTCENKFSIGLRLIDEAKRQGVASVSAIDMAVNADRRFRGESELPLAHAPDWLLVPDMMAKQAYESLGYPCDRVIVSGHPHYAYVQALAKQFASYNQKEFRRSILPTVPLDRLVLTFLSEPHSIMNPELTRRTADYTLSGHSGSDFRTQIVLEELIDALAFCSPNPYLVVRLHPKNSPDEFSSMMDKIDLVSSGGNPLELVWVSDLIVGMSSMLLLEAALMNKPTLSVVPRPQEQERLASTAIGITPCITQSQQLRTTLKAWTDGKGAPIGTTKKNASEVFEPDALERVVEFLKRLLSSQ